MTNDPVLVLGWLALAHLVADFVIQTETVATEKFGDGARAWRALLAHVIGVVVCLVPVVAAFGGPGLAFLVVVALVHGLIDRTKIVLTRRVEARATRRARVGRESEPADAASSLGAAWTPMPGFLFVADQLAHAVVIGAAWAALLSGAPLTSEFVDAVRRLPSSWDPDVVHRIVLTTVILTDLAIVNVRAGLLFVATLVHPRAPSIDDETVGEQELASSPGLSSSDRAQASESRRAGSQPGSANPSQAAAGWTVRIGPLEVDAIPRASEPSWLAGQRTEPPAEESAPSRMQTRRPVAPPAQVGAAVGVLERLIVVSLVLSGASAAIGFVIAAKTLARFKQLDDRDFAEYYLLGTLASVAVALLSGLVGVAALASG